MKRLFVFGLILLTALSTYAVYDQELIDANNIGIYISNFGIVGQNCETGASGCWWPSGFVAETYIFGSGMWIGGLVDTAFIISGGDTTFFFDTLVSCGYNANSGGTEFVPGDGSDNPAPYDDYAFRVYLSDQLEYPIDSILSQLDSYCVMNEMDESKHFTSENKPLGLVVEQFTYEFSSIILADVFFIRLSVINTTGKKIRQAYISYNIDSDIGNEAGDAANDLLGFITEEDIGYQFQLEEEVGWTNYPGVIGWTYIQGPIATDTVDVYHDGSKIIYPGDSLGMTSFTNYTISNDPFTKQARYLAMAGYDYTVFDPLNPEASYHPFPSWGTGVIGYPGETQDSTLGADKRFMISSGPFDIQPYDTVELVVAFAINSDPDQIITTLNTAKNWWKNRNTDYVTLINPSIFQKVSSPFSFTWNASRTLPYYSLTLRNMNSGLTTAYSGDNTFSALIDPLTLQDGLYKWNISNYSFAEAIISKENRYVVIDNPGINGAPCIFAYESETDGGKINFNWRVSDPDNNLSYQTISLTDTNGRMVFSANLSPSDSQFSLNAYNNIPNGLYVFYLTAVDDSSAVDSLIDSQSIYFNRPGDDAYFYGGDNNTVQVSYITYNKTLYTGHTYEVRFDWPFKDVATENLMIPFTVVDSNSGSEEIADTARYSYSGETFYSKLFDGVGLSITYINSFNQICDSIKILNDVNNNYPDSVLKCNSTIQSVFMGRDVKIYWHGTGDSVRADFIFDGYADNLEYSNLKNCTYSFGTGSYTSEYLMDSTITRTAIYTAGATIYLNMPLARAYPMDTLWAPEEGEVWQLFTSGDKLPVKGDICRVHPTGLESFALTVDRNVLSLSCNVKGNTLSYSINGIGGEVELNLYDIQGRKVITLFKGAVAGRISKKIVLSIPNGIYFIKEMNGGFETKKILMIK
ncbi:MAG: T9SS type A sorting domain-containing protein [bacterium]